MQFLWNRSTFCIFLIVILQSFCTLKLLWLNSLLAQTSTEIFSLKNGTTFICTWAVVSFFSRIMGGHTLGKYAEKKGFMATQKILISGYILTTALFFLSCLFADQFQSTKLLMLVISYSNLFLGSAALVSPAMYLMKISKTSDHVNISMFMIFGSGLGYVLAYAVSAKCNLQNMSGIIFGCSLLCGYIFYCAKKGIINLEKSHTPEKQKPPQNAPNTVAKFLAVLIGGVCGAGLSHNYFFIEPYVLNVSIINARNFQMGYMFFYIALGLFMMLASRICDFVDWSKLMFISLIGVLLVMFSLSIYDVSKGHIYLIYQVLFAFFFGRICDFVDWSKLMFISLIGVLLVMFSLSIYDVSKGHIYLIYQVLFAFFFAGFLAPSLALVFSLFKNSQPFYNGIFWYSSGISISYLIGYFLSKDLLGIFHHYFLFVSPLVFNAVLCLALMFAVKLSIVSTHSKASNR